jgi:hypothetical protein
MVTFKILVALLSLCATLFVAALAQTQTPLAASVTAMPASKLAVRNAPRQRLDPIRSITATPSNQMADPAVKLITLELPKPSATATTAAAPTPVPSPTPSFVFETSLDAVTRMKPVEALRLLTGRQFARFPQRVTTTTRNQQGETLEHTLTIVSADRWSEKITTAAGTSEIIQIGPVRYRHQGGTWTVDKATHDSLPTADVMARDAAESIELLAGNVELEGDYALNGRATLLYYFAYHKQKDSGSRVWFDKQTLQPTLSETTLEDGTTITVNYEYDDALSINPPVRGGW